MSAEAIKSRFKPTSGKSILYLLFSDLNLIVRETTRGHAHPPFTKEKTQVFFWGKHSDHSHSLWGIQTQTPCSDTDHCHVASTYHPSMCPPNYCPCCAMETSRRGILHPLEIITSAFSLLVFWIASSTLFFPCNIHIFLSSNGVWVGLPSLMRTICILTVLALNGLQESSLYEPGKPKTTGLVRSQLESRLTAALQYKHVSKSRMFCCNSKQTERGCALDLCSLFFPSIYLVVSKIVKRKAEFDWLRKR